jgi:hypothetical protein
MRPDRPRHGQLDDAFDEVSVRKLRLRVPRRHGELRGLVQPRVRVHLDDVRGAVGGQAHVDAGVVADEERLGRALRDALEPGHQRRIVHHILGHELLGRLHLRALVLLPLRFLAGDPRHVGRKLRQIPFDGRQHDRRVAEEANVDLAAVDVLLDERGGVELAVDGEDARHQLVDAVDDGAGVDADGGVGGDRFHE